MLFELLFNYVDTFTFLNVFKYITFRTGLAFFTSLLITLLIGGPFIKLFSTKKIFNPIREDGPSDHIIKKIGTPTMGGVIILIGLIVSVLLWADLKNIYILFCLYIVSSFGILGAYDDYKKIINSSSSGISSKLKIIVQVFLAFIGLAVLTYFVNYEEFKNLYFPFFKNLIINLGWFFIPFSIFVIVGSSNAVNLTDGLDGLATVPVILVAGCFAFISYVSGNIFFQNIYKLFILKALGKYQFFVEQSLEHVWVFCGLMHRRLKYLWGTQDLFLLGVL